MSDLAASYEGAERTTTASYNAMAADWAASRADPNYWAAELERFHDLLPEGEILEIGSGGGRDAKELIGRGYGYVGTDISTGLLNVARKELPGQQFYEQSVYDLSLPEHEPFDGFWTSAVLLHIPKARIAEALTSIKRTLNPRAIGFISLKDGAGEQIVTTDTDNGAKLERFFSFWRKDEFAVALNESGYGVVDYMLHPAEKNDWHGFFVQVQ
jgi:SAM-dependent methyltransferase